MHKRAAAQHQPRREAKSVFRRAAEREVDPMRRAAIPHGRHAAVQRLEGVDRGVHQRDHLIDR